jgi:transposase
MSEITTIGLDLAKSVFQVYGINEAGREVTRKRLRRGQMLTFFAGLPPCLVGMEACATAHPASGRSPQRNRKLARAIKRSKPVDRRIEKNLQCLKGP